MRALGYPSEPIVWKVVSRQGSAWLRRSKALVSRPDQGPEVPDDSCQLFVRPATFTVTLRKVSRGGVLTLCQRLVFSRKQATEN